MPVTLGYVTKYSFQGNPLIAPYPNWEMNTLDGNCNHIISVFRIKVKNKFNSSFLFIYFFFKYFFKLIFNFVNYFTG